MEIKLRKRSDIAPKKVDDKAHLSVNKSLPDGFQTENHDLLRHYQMLWHNLRDFRERRARAMRYQRGDQWSDFIYNPDTKEWIKEEEYIRAQGKVPLKQNIIRQLIKNLQGQYRRSPTKTIVYARNREDAATSEMMSNAIQAVHDLNSSRHLDAANLTEGAHSGMFIGKYVYTILGNRDIEDIYFKNVNPHRVFFNGDLEDPRLDDLRDIGEIHDMSLQEVVSTFAQNPTDEAKIKRWYSVDYYKDFMSGAGNALSSDYSHNMDFFITSNPGMCRVIEGWSKKAEWRTWVHDYYDGSYKVVDMDLSDIKRLNDQRIQQYAQMGELDPENVPLMEAKRYYDEYWYVKYMTPYGHTLFEGETMYDHKEHPYIMMLYPFINGEVWGLVEDVIDQQRYVNRNITLMDFIISASAKGLLLVPEDSIPAGMNISDFASEWSRVGGVVKYKAKPGVPVPQQISNNSIPSGLQEMLTMQIKLTYDIMGIHAAIQGQTPRSGTAASLYAQEAENATINIKDFMDTFVEFKKKRDTKVMKLIKQYYRDRKILSVHGTNYAPEAKVYDPAMVNQIEFDLTVAQGADTPVYRQIIDDILTNLLTNQFIDLEMYLEHSSMPFADKLLETVKRKRQEMSGEGGAVPNEEVLQQLQQGDQHLRDVDPRAANLVDKFAAN